MSPTDADFKKRFRHAATLRDEGNFSAATAVLKELVSERPLEKASWIVLGHIHWEQEALQEAIECFRKATHLDQSSEVASLALYHTLWSSGQQAEALEEMKRFVQISHSDEYDRILQAFREESALEG